eukprot:gene1560-1821_t
MHNPPHPGEILLEDVIPALGITITEMARRLGFARETFSRILHGHAPISPDLAVRLERAVPMTCGRQSIEINQKSNGLHGLTDGYTQANPASTNNASNPIKSGTLATCSPTCTAANSSGHNGTST